MYRFISAMDDDFNTAQAIAALFNLAQGINRAVNLGHADKVIEHREIFMELTAVLGLILPEPHEYKSFEAKLYHDLLNLYKQGNYRNAIELLDPSFEDSFGKLVKRLVVYNYLDKLVGAAHHNTQFYKQSLNRLRNQLLSNSQDSTKSQACLEDLKAIYETAEESIELYKNYRNQGRANKNWQLADEIRAQLESIDIILEDTPKETVSKYKL
ncbi:DALR domain-containing protein [Chloroflexota bacterium]